MGKTFHVMLAERLCFRVKQNVLMWTVDISQIYKI